MMIRATPRRMTYLDAISASSTDPYPCEERRVSARGEQSGGERPPDSVHENHDSHCSECEAGS
jgi:hypothetical protein